MTDANNGFDDVVKVTAKELARDLVSLPIDISNVEFVDANHFERLKAQHEKDRAEIEGLRAALEDRDKMHDEHVHQLNVIRMRDAGKASARIAELEALVRQAKDWITSPAIDEHHKVLMWIERATKALGGEE